jgi:hypothetical protein
MSVEIFSWDARADKGVVDEFFPPMLDSEALVNTIEWLFGELFTVQLTKAVVDGIFGDLNTMV